MSAALRVAKLVPYAKLPVKSSAGAAAFDLFSSECVTVYAREQRIVPTGIVVEIPHGYYGQILSRSSLAIKYITVQGGCIDSDYRGEVKCIVENRSQEAYTIYPLHRFAQLAIIKTSELEQVEQVTAEQLQPTARGSAGFGSTGDK